MIIIFKARWLLMLALTELRGDAKGRITDLQAVSSLVRRRLGDLGVMEGAIVTVRKLLPFGGPCTIESNGQWIAIRRKEAQSIRVETL